MRFARNRGCRVASLTNFWAGSLSQSVGLSRATVWVWLQLSGLRDAC